MGLFTRIFGNKKETDVWPQFAGRLNDEPLLREKAVALAPVLMQSGNHPIDAIQELIPATKIDTVTLLLELIIVKLHMVNRIAIEQLGSDRRNWFMEPLEKEIIDRIAALYEDAAKDAEFKDGFWKHYTDSTQGYTSYTYAAEQNKHGGLDIQRTIAWKLADNLGQGEDLATIMGLQILITELVVVLFKNLQLRQLVGRFPENVSRRHQYESFEEWYIAYKQAAGRANPQLKNNSLIDFMEDEPLKRAFRDGIDPESLARDFASQFDITTFDQ